MSTDSTTPETPKDGVHRRDFVKTAGAVTAAAAAVTSGPLVRKAKARDTQVKYGFIGPGSRGFRLLERHLQHIDAGECVAICDIYEPNLKQALELFGGKPTPYTDYRKLLEDPEVEAIFCTVPLWMHYPVMSAALQAGKHVFCEKSLVFTPAEVHGLRKVHEENKDLVVQVGLQRRYSDFYSRAKELIDAGAIGQVTHIQAQWHRNTNWVRKVKDESMFEQINWRLFRKYSGGLCAELMSHQVDVADMIFGSTPTSVMGVGGLDYWKDGRDIYDNIQLIFEYPTGQKLQYSAISTNRHIEGRRVPGDGCREIVMGLDGAVELTLIPYGEGMRFVDPMKKKMGGEKDKDEATEAWKAGSTVGSDELEQGDGIPIDPNFADLNADGVGFIEKELGFARRWAYNKGIMTPAEDKDPEYKELESFLNDILDGGHPKADIEVGIQDSIAVMLANLAMDEERKVYFSEIEEMGLDGVEMTSASDDPSADD